MLTLKIPSADGGEEEGLNDPGVELFLGPVEHHIAREAAQNAIDAKAPGCARVELSFDLLRMAQRDIPTAPAIIDVLRRCREFWKANRKSRDFFDAAIVAMQARELNVLRISDRFTTGLTGSDTDRSDRWYGLVRSAGVSNKDEGAGGSFGIGKYAPFAASPIRTVFYSTKTATGAVAFQGILRLASHTDAAEHVTRRTGYIGDCSGRKCAALRVESEIPAAFRRADAGTDIYIVGYAASTGWDQQLIASILTNFWPAIYAGTIAFNVNGKVVDDRNLEALLNGFAAQGEFEAQHYYKALSQGTRHEETIQGLGRVALYLAADGEDLPKRVAMTRKTGMVIELKIFRSRRPFSGYFVCDDPDGNELLRSMEPPRHNEWDPARGDAKASRALRDLYAWVRSRVKALNPVPTTEALDVPELARYLPFDDEADQNVEAKAGAEQSPENNFTPVPRPRPIEVHPAPDAKPTVLQTVPEGGDGAGENAGGQDGGTGGGGGGDEGGDAIGGGAGGGNAGKQPSRAPAKPKLTLRSFRRSDGRYELVVRSMGAGSGGFRLLAVGEDGRTEPTQVLSAHDAATGGALPASGPRIDAAVGAASPIRIIVEIDGPITPALAVEAL